MPKDERSARLLRQLVGIRRKDDGRRLEIAVRHYVRRENVPLIARTSKPLRGTENGMGIRNVNRLLTSLKRDFSKVHQLAGTPFYSTALRELLGFCLDNSEHEELIRVLEAEKS